ncbi:MAG: hypothetical protein WAL50_05550 [Kineosporiaceae bacterium]
MRELIHQVLGPALGHLGPKRPGGNVLGMLGGQALSLVDSRGQFATDAIKFSAQSLSIGLGSAGPAGLLGQLGLQTLDLDPCLPSPPHELHRLASHPDMSPTMNLGQTMPAMACAGMRRTSPASPQKLRASDDDLVAGNVGFPAVPVRRNWLSAA